MNSGAVGIYAAVIAELRDKFWTQKKENVYINVKPTEVKSKKKKAMVHTEQWAIS